MTYQEIKAELALAIDLKYKAFNEPIVNSEYKTLGVRTPLIRKLVKRVQDRDEFLEAFFADSEKVYETVLLAGCVAAKKGDYEYTRDMMRRIIPLFGSWGHVDCVIPMLDWTDRDRFLTDFRYLLDCEGQYEVRSYIIYMFDCLTPERIDFVLDTLKFVRYGRYYVDMGAAWLLAECLVKFYDKTLPLFTSAVFPRFVHNKAIQKARESFRVTAEQKAYLKTLALPRK